MLIAASVTIVLSILTMLTLKQSKFGRLPSGKRLERIKRSPNYKNGSFQNLS